MILRLLELTRLCTAFPPPAGKHDDGMPLNRSQESEGTLPGEEHVDKNAFDHPATYEVSFPRIEQAFSLTAD